MFILQLGSGLEELWESCAEDDGTNWQPTTGYCFSQRVQVGQQIVDLLLFQGVLESRHIATAEHDGVAGAVIIGGGAAGQRLLAKDALQSRPLSPAGGVGVVTGDAACIIDGLAALFLRGQRTTSGI